MEIESRLTNRENLKNEIQLTNARVDLLETEIRESSHTNNVNLQNVHDSAADERDLRATVHLHNFVMAKAEALRRSIHAIDSGTYGLCRECGCEIDKRRLAAAPEATLCLSCQVEREEIEQRESEKHVSTPGLQNMRFVPQVA